LPFDTLGIEIGTEERKEIAVIHAERLSRFSRAVEGPKPGRPRGEGRNKLNLAYICYDFNDHPTAHLAEGLFLHHNRTGRVNVDAFNYGKDDNSTYRRNIVDLLGGKEEEGGNFVELTELTDGDSAVKAKGREAHVLIDMQGFTLGGRPEITARR